VNAADAADAMREEDVAKERRGEEKERERERERT